MIETSAAGGGCSTAPPFHLRLQRSRFSRCDGQQQQKQSTTNRHAAAAAVGGGGDAEENCQVYALPIEKVVNRIGSSTRQTEPPVQHPLIKLVSSRLPVTMGGGGSLFCCSHEKLVAFALRQNHTSIRLVRYAKCGDDSPLSATPS